MSAAQQSNASDALPGRCSTTVIQSVVSGTVYGQCSEICGTHPRLHAYTLSMGVAVLYSCSNTVMLVNKLPVTMADLLHTCTVRLDEYNSILIIVEEAVNDKA